MALFGRIGTSFLPMSPLPPITTIFMSNLLCALCYSTSATDQRASLSGLSVMYTARTPPSMRRDTTEWTAPPDRNTTPGSPFTVATPTSCMLGLLNTPARNRAALPPADHDPRRRHLAAAVGVDLDVLGEHRLDRLHVPRPARRDEPLGQPVRPSRRAGNRVAVQAQPPLARLTICRTAASDLPTTSAISAYS